MTLDWSVYAVEVCSECNEPSCGEPAQPVTVEMVPLDEALAEVERLRASLRRQVAGRDAEALASREKLVERKDT